MTTDFAKRTSLKIPKELPEFIRSTTEYQTFVSFIQAYYEWMEQSNTGSGKEGPIYSTQNLLNYSNIDFVKPGESFNKFIDYFINDFMPNFPKDALADKAKLIKIARQLYTHKGTPSSYQFLFRALYNSDAEIFLTRDAVLKASDGKWYVSKSLRLDTNDENWLSTNNLRIFGETSKSIATIERAIAVGDNIEVYISNIQRLFQSGENVKIVDNNNQPVYFKDGEIVASTIVGAGILEAKILGSISSVDINPQKRGRLYVGRSSTYSGDPVIFYGGLNSPTGVGARAFVSETTAGSLRSIEVIDGSYGYRQDPNTVIRFTGGGGSGAIANVSTVDPATEINVAFIPSDYLSTGVRNMTIGGVYTALPANTSANVNCTLANALSFIAYSTYSIDTVILNNGGGGYTSLPAVSAISIYDTLDPNISNPIKGDLGALGILGPITISTPGTGYANGDIVVFANSAGGVGANANVKVNSTGSIVLVEYQFSNGASSTITTPKGGLGYRQNSLPTLEIISSGGSGAELTVTNILGTGAEFSVTDDERGIGAITSFVIENFGEDYISAPNVSLRVRDLIVKNVNPSDVVKAGELIYQGPNVKSSVFRAFVDSISLLQEDVANTEDSLYTLRTYNYTSNTKTDLQLKITDRVSGSNLYIDLVTSYNTLDASGNFLFRNGIRTYGNGAAQATARFLNGLIIGQGQYLNDDGFPSSFQVLEDEDYNNFTYRLTVEKSFEAYKEVLYQLLHPSGMKVIPFNALKSQQTIDVHRETFQSNSRTLGGYTGNPGSNAAIYTTFENPSNNIIQLFNLVGANIEAIAQTGMSISLNSQYGPNVYSGIVQVIDSTSNTIIIRDNVFTSFANVATANVLTSNNRINIRTITDQYDLINNGEYSNTQNKLQDIVFIGDRVRVVNGSSVFHGTVTYVSYSNGVIFANTTISFSSDVANVSIGRNINSLDVKIYDSLGTIYYPELLTQDDRNIITQDERVLILG
jgi:hypothetical protein